MEGSPYQILQPLSESEFASLKSSIRDHGVLVPIEMDQNENILDGHHRARAVKELRAEGVDVGDVPYRVRSFDDEAAKRSYARHLNLARRQLNQKQKRQVIRDQLRDTPKLSNREIARRLGVGHKLVGRQRKELEATGAIPQLDTRTGADGKQRPATKPTRTVPAESETEAREAAGVLRGDVGDEPAEDDRMSRVPPDHVYHRLGDMLRHERRQKDMSVTDLSDRVGVSKTIVSKVERMKRLPSRELCRRLSDALDLPESYVLVCAGWAPGHKYVDLIGSAGPDVWDRVLRETMERLLDQAA